MPFTPAHAAAALPLRRVRALPFDALVIGTMVPDLPLFVSFAPNYMWTHSRFFALPVCLPWAIGLLLLARFAWPSTVWLFPEWWRSRVPERGPELRNTHWGMVCAALAIGIVTHVLWDSFTHEDRWGVKLLPLLSQTWLPVTPIGALPGFKVLQYGTSVLGLVLVAHAARAALLRRAPHAVARSARATRVRVAIWALVLALGPLISLVRAYIHARRFVDGFKHVLTHDFAGGALVFAAVVLLVFAAGRALIAPGVPAGGE
jgi:hypothetical protein